MPWTGKADVKIEGIKSSAQAVKNRNLVLYLGCQQRQCFRQRARHSVTEVSSPARENEQKQGAGRTLAQRQCVAQAGVGWWAAGSELFVDNGLWCAPKSAEECSGQHSGGCEQMLRKTLDKKEGRVSAVDVKVFILDSWRKHEIPFEEIKLQYEIFLKIKMENHNFLSVS